MFYLQILICSEEFILSLVTYVFFPPRCICLIDCFKRFLLIWLSRAYALKSMIDALGKPPSSLPHQKKKKRKRVKKLFIIRRKEKALLKGKKEEQKKCQHATLKVYVVIVICRELDD
uniref:Uncharacterized protein n=1 Tax=Opuntia streptacantha TaxID=393608 RepID=A0A7C9AAD0_OPUST